jgi:glycosyltransferase involved in cell wall biosynthesis
LLFPGEEDFGIVPVEAQACGAPVIALGRGGAAETVLPMNGKGLSESQEPTGLWFGEQTMDGLITAMEAFEACKHEFHPAAARRQALHFNPRRFQEELFAYLANVLQPTSTPVRKAA